MSKKWKTYYDSIFSKYDKDGNGQMDVQELATMLRENNEVSEKLVKKLVKSADQNNDNRINITEFTEMMLDKRYKALFGQYMRSYVDFVVPRDKRGMFRQVGRRVGSDIEVDGRGRTSSIDGTYEDGFSCFPPPVCMVLVSIAEIICFILNEHVGRGGTVEPGGGPIAEVLIYNPEKRQECWRFLTYMFVHIGWVHLTMNLLTQIFLGLALELRNRWYRVLTVYMAGVVAGSLVTSIMDPGVFLAGASGGVYAILTAHLSNIIINWSEMAYPIIQLIIFILLIAADVSTAIHNRYQGDQTPIGYAAHFGGALAGFLVGIWVLKNVEPTKKEKYLWWAAFVVYVLLMGVAIIMNVFWKGHFLATAWGV
ncbi:unnamed protein product [Ceutorhynchus assimilis]|uniref:EF-hand domain-containing protein n=1 Tax=Ceutorhynchus assimilis TaxID=467358 RepID=A0A9P0DJU2_9CUCU|nr:unnamed protein product [Ceutorhynchus assimilis]